MNKKILCNILLISIFLLLSILPFVNYVKCTQDEEEDDLKIFKHGEVVQLLEQSNLEIECLCDTDYIQDTECLDCLYCDLCEECECPDATPVPDEDYDDYSHIDITNVEIEDSGKDDAKFKITTVGNPSKPKKDYVFYLWYNCSDSDESYLIVVYYSKKDNSTSQSGFHDGEEEADLVVYTTDTTINIDIPSDWCDDPDDNIKVITITGDEDGDKAVDIYEHDCPNLFIVNMWWVLLLVVISLITIIYLYIKNKK